MSETLYGVTDEGFVLKRLDTILEEVQQAQAEGWGFDSSVNNQSAVSVLNTSFADQVAALWEMAQNIYYAMYPSSAEGVNLDNAMQFGGITRLQQARTVYSLKCTGNDGTSVLYGSLVQSTTQPSKQFQAADTQSISRENFRRIKLYIVLSDDATTYTVTIDNGTYVYAASDDDTEMDILEGILSAITDESFVLSIEEDEDDAAYLVVEAVNAQSSSEMTLSDNVLVAECTSNLIFESVEYGEISVPTGTITEIVTITTGWNAVDNDISPVAGNLTETDAEARQSYIQRIAIRSYSMLESIIAAIYNNVQGVTAATGYENDTEEEDDDGRSPHSIEIVVDGGDDSEIAQQIYESKANGIQTNGSVSVDIADNYGNYHNIKFNRPESLYVWLQVTLTRNTKESIAPNYSARTKEAIIENADDLTVGETVFVQQFLSNIYANVTGIGYISIKAYATTSSSAVPTTYPLDNIEVGVRQKATFDEDRIEVSLIGD